MQLGFGLVTCQRHPADPEKRTDAVLYEQALDLARLADRAGLGSYWVSEHHFVDDGYLPATFALLAAAAAVTERIALGSGVLLAPLWHPVRIAEDAATVDLISHGRLILGLGLGWREEEFIGFGTNLKSRVRALEQAVTILRDAWAPDRLATEEKVAVTPKPFRPGGPPIWIGAVVEAAILRAGRIGDGYFAVAYSFEEFESRAMVLRKIDRSVTISVHAPVFIWDGPEDPWEVVRGHYWYMRWKYTDMAAARSRVGPAPLPPPLDREQQATLRRDIIVGRPEQVLAELRRFKKIVTEHGHFVARAYYPGMPWSLQRRQVELLGELARELAG